MPQQTKAPYGDIVYVSTPTLDRWGQQMYQEQKLLEARRQQENAALDANIQKEIGKVRSVDTPEVIKSYQNYKALKQQLLFNKKLQNDPLAYNQAKQAADQAYQNIFSTANKSAELKELGKSLTSEAIKNPNGMVDDYGRRISTLMNTPVSVVGNHPEYGDLTNFDNYRYQGSNTDFGKMARDAAGQAKQVFSKEESMDGGLQTKITPYHFGNTPAQVKDSLLGTMAMRQAGRDAAYQWDHLPEEEIESTIKQYQAIPKEKWERMGLPGPQDLMPKNPDNKAENYAAYQAMKYAISNEPKEATPVFRDNKKAVLNWQLNKDKIMEGIRHGNRMAEISFRDQLKDKGEGEQNDYMDELYDGLKTDAKKNRKVYRPANGKPYDQYSIKATEGVKKLFATKDAKGHQIFPDELRFSKDFGTVTPIFFEHYVDQKTGNRLPEIIKNPKTGEAEVVKDLSTPILEPEFKERWKKEIMGVQLYGKTLKNKKPTTGNYKIEGKSYSHKQLNDMGYDDVEIDQAIKSGIISK